MLGVFAPQLPRGFHCCHKVRTRWSLAGCPAALYTQLAARGRLCSYAKRKVSAAAAAPYSDATAPTSANTAQSVEPLGSSFVRPPPLIDRQRTHSCRRCGGTANLPCGTCSGLGRLQRGGYHKRNSVSLARIQGSKWTALQKTLGRTFFTVTAKSKQGKETFVLLAATCDPNTQLWLNATNLKDRSRWASSWLQRDEMRLLDEGGATCKKCAGTGLLECPLCTNAGCIVEI